MVPWSELNRTRGKRTILIVSWTESKTNEEFLKMANTTSSLLPTIKKRKCPYFGHVIRARSIQKLLLEDKIEGKRGRGRPLITWMKNIKEWLGHTYSGCVRGAEQLGFHDSRATTSRWHSMMRYYLNDWNWLV